MKESVVSVISTIISFLTLMVMIVMLIFLVSLGQGSRPDDLNGILEIKKKLEERKNKIPKIVYDYVASQKFNRFNIEHESSYLHFILDLPWFEHQAEEKDEQKVYEKLDQTHYGLINVKEQVIEFLRSKKEFGADNPEKALLLKGCPGIGKTTFAQSIATSLNRCYFEISLAGVKDASFLYGHGKSYISSQAGAIIKGINECKCNNPVILLDEIDKVGSVEVANLLLAILDPAQSKKFVDHYVNFAFDLSNVFFIATANNIDHLDSALKDRLKIIELPNYTAAEMNHIFNEKISKQLIFKLKDVRKKKSISFENDFFKETFDGCFTDQNKCYSLTNRKIFDQAQRILNDFIAKTNWTQFDEKNKLIIKKKDFLNQIDLRCDVLNT